MTSITPALSLDAECGVTKGCLLYPSTCSGDNCRFALAYSPTDDGQHLQFEMMGDVDEDNYFSVGFSHDKTMVSSCEIATEESKHRAISYKTFKNLF